MPKTIVFDMGNVLIQYQPHRFVARHTSDPDTQKLLIQELFSGAEWVGLDRGSVTEEEAYEAVSQRLPNELHPLLKTLLETWFQDLLPMPGMASLVEDLRARGHKLYILSNAGQCYYEYRHIIPGIAHFDGEFVSSDHGLLKPSPHIYEKFCKTYELEPQNCIFIDDSAANVEEAQRFGMKAIVFHGDATKLTSNLDHLLSLDAGERFLGGQKHD